MNATKMGNGGYSLLNRLSAGQGSKCIKKKARQERGFLRVSSRYEWEVSAWAIDQNAGNGRLSKLRMRGQKCVFGFLAKGHVIEIGKQLTQRSKLLSVVYFIFRRSDTAV